MAMLIAAAQKLDPKTYFKVQRRPTVRVSGVWRLATAVKQISAFLCLSLIRWLAVVEVEEEGDHCSIEGGAHWG